MGADTLSRVLEATGYLPQGEPAPGMFIGRAIREQRRRARHFAPDAMWRGHSALTVYFKYEPARPPDEVISAWRREIWNEGFAPLLWVISPERIDLYNGYGTPLPSGREDAAAHLLRTFENIEAELVELDALAGRLVMETGQFWSRAPEVDRRTSVDQKLLSDLRHLEKDLVGLGLGRSVAQGLIGRAIFTQYLADREIVTAERLQALCGHDRIAAILREPAATAALFNWLAETFNGDMFPERALAAPPGRDHLARVADFLDAIDPITEQLSLFPYQFDLIPVELISSIYEQFAHMLAADGDAGSDEDAASARGVHYTKLPLVSLVLDETMDNLSGQETVLDLACGSAVFLVQALRRLAYRRAGGRPDRKVVRSILYEQIYGMDVSEAAIRVAAFSLYLAALELDPDPRPPEALKFRPLIGETLFHGDAHTIERTGSGAKLRNSDGSLRKFDVIVGNPPWSFRGRAGTAIRRGVAAGGTPLQPRGEGLDFVRRAMDFAHDRTRFGLVLSAMPFFSASNAGKLAARYIVEQLAPVTIVNLAALRSWLFPRVKMPAIALFAGHRPKQQRDLLTVVQVPWSSAGARSSTFEIAPSDVMTFRAAEWERHPGWFKAAAVGKRRDLLLLDALTGAHAPLSKRVAAFGAVLRDGIIIGRPANRERDARALRGLPFLRADDLRPLRAASALPLFEFNTAQWPRTRETYRAPLLLVKEVFRNRSPRALTAVVERDVVFTDAFFGASFPPDKLPAAHLLAAVLSSAVASWFFLMTGAEFGLWKQRLFDRDVELLPTPDLEQAVYSPAGQRVLECERRLRQERGEISESDWGALDEAVADLYGLDQADRVVVGDGLFRASWEWRAGRDASIQPAGREHLTAYASSFLSVVDGWLSALGRRRMRGEIFDLPSADPLRVIRFILEEQPGPSDIAIVRPDVKLHELLARIGERLNVKLGQALVGTRELRVHGRDELIVIKPAARRHWLGVAGLDDADAVTAESIAGAAA
jgi:hypothetical protein